ncbi:unnamed protein product [Rhodiola kirilowii]
MLFFRCLVHLRPHGSWHIDWCIIIEDLAHVDKTEHDSTREAPRDTDIPMFCSIRASAKTPIVPHHRNRVTNLFHKFNVSFRKNT